MTNEPTPLLEGAIDEMMGVLIQRPEDFLRVHLFEGMMKQAATARKAENARLIQLEKKWQAAKKEAEGVMLKILLELGESSPQNPDARKIKTLVGTSYIRQQDWKVKIDEEAILEMEPPRDPDQEREFWDLVDTYQEHTNHLTPKSIKDLQRLAMDSVEEFGVEPDWADVTPAGPIVCHKVGKWDPKLDDPAFREPIKRILDAQD